MIKDKTIELFDETFETKIIKETGIQIIDFNNELCWSEIGYNLTVIRKNIKRLEKIDSIDLGEVQKSLTYLNKELLELKPNSDKFYYYNRQMKIMQNLIDTIRDLRG